MGSMGPYTHMQTILHTMRVYQCTHAHRIITQQHLLTYKYHTKKKKKMKKRQTEKHKHINTNSLWMVTVKKLSSRRLCQTKITYSVHWESSPTQIGLSAALIELQALALVTVLCLGVKKPLVPKIWPINPTPSHSHLPRRTHVVYVSWHLHRDHILIKQKVI